MFYKICSRRCWKHFESTPESTNKGQVLIQNKVNYKYSFTGLMEFVNYFKMTFYCPHLYSAYILLAITVTIINPFPNTTVCSIWFWKHMGPPRWFVGGRGFVPGRVILRTFKIVGWLPSYASRVAGLLLQLTGCFQDKWKKRTGNLPRKLRDITETILNTTLVTNQLINENIWLKL